MYSSDYAAYKHILDDSKIPSISRLNSNGSSKEISSSTFGLSKLKDCPKHLLPINSRKQFEKNLDLNAHSYLNDFILISEFSEIEGPKPLFSIPIDGGMDFNKNDYSLHVMCVDFHVQNVHKFSLNKDTAIINCWNLNNGGIASYIHHFTLYDIEARGFVRPFCISYITYDKQKITKYFKQLNNEICQITELLKKSNYCLFRADLEDRLANLMHTRNVYEEWLVTSDEDKLKFYEKYEIDCRIESKFQKYSLNTFDMIINQITNLLSVLNDYLLNNVANIQTENQQKSQSCVTEHKNETHFDRSQSYPLYTNQTMSQEPKIIFDLQTGATIASSHYHEPVGFTSKTQNNKLMKSIHELAKDTARLAINKLRLVHKTFSKNFLTLKFRDIESYYLKNSNKNCCVTMGDCLMSDFSSRIDVETLNQSLLTNNESLPININERPQDILQHDEYFTPICTGPLNDYDGSTVSSQESVCLSRAMSRISFNEQDETDYDFAESYKKYEELTSNETSLIADKYHRIYELNFEAILKLTILKNYKNFLPHLLYSIVKGRPLVIISRYKSDLDKLTSISNCLASFIPNTTHIKITYESKPIKLIDIKQYKLICLTMAINKLSLIDPKTHSSVTFDDSSLLLKYIPITIRNYVSILDIDKNTFVGPKYNGIYLTTLLSKLKYFQEDSVSYLFLLSRLNYYIRLTYLYDYSLIFSKNNGNESPNQLLDTSLHTFDRRTSSASRTSSTRSSIISLNESESRTEPPEQIREKLSLFKNHLVTQYSQMGNYFDVSDYNIVDNLLRSLEIKQLQDSISKWDNQQQQQQQPLIVNYEHLVTFNS